MGSIAIKGPQKALLNDREIGRRLRIARETARLSQEKAANKVGLARTTLVAIEQGNRGIRTEELLGLAKLYGRSANAILRSEVVHVDLVPLFREIRRVASDNGVEAARFINDFASAEVELENSLGVNRVFDYPRERPLLPGPPKQQAEDDAQELRWWLGLGPGPVRDIMTLLEMQIGIRVYSYPIDSSISGLFAWHEALGACMLFNSKHPPQRRKFTAAHELGHFMSMRATPTVLMAKKQPKSREEQYANCFASAFLMPKQAVRQRFAQVTSGQSYFTRRHVILLAHMLDVSREAIVRRLEELELVRSGTWDWFNENGGITDKQAQEVLGETTQSPPALRERWLLPIRLALLAREAWERDLYSEGQLGRMLHLHRRDLRKILYEVSDEEKMANRLSY